MKREVKNKGVQIKSNESHCGSHARMCRKLLPALIAACFVYGQANSPAWANPTGAQIVNGQVNINNHGNVLTITNSPGSVINWQSFSIGPGELTQFLQQSANSAVLNRIVGQDPSQIFGALQSNGKVYLINPNGIMFGAGSRINVGGLVASSLDLGNADFSAGKLNFTGSALAGAVSNQGSITTPAGGQIYLIAPQVKNTGILTSPQGEVLLAAGHSVQLVDGGDPNIQVVISAPSDQALNLGQIVAQGGKVGIYGALVNQNGIVSADSAVRGEHGEILFKSSQTTMLAGNSLTSATGQDGGGSIELLGPQVGLTDTAKVDASGQTGGGTVLVGGDFHGTNPAIVNAAQTYVGPQASIRADAIQRGNGGKVAVWSDQQTEVYGNISVQGGAQGGNGGFVETSSRQYLNAAVAPDLAAPRGKAGEWLLDPDAITITSGGNTNINAGPFIPVALGTVSTLSDATLAAAIGAGGIVTVDTTSTLAGTGNITITGAAALATLNAGAGAMLNLYAYNDININSSIKNTGNPLAINIVANKYGSGATGMVNVADGVQIIANNAPIAISGTGINIGVSTGATVSTGNTAGNGSGVAPLALISSNGGITVSAGSSLLANSGINLQDTGTGVITINGSTGFAVGTGLPANTAVSTGGAITVGAAGILSNAATGGNVGLLAGTGIALNGAISASGGTVGLETASGNISQGSLTSPGTTASLLGAVAPAGAVAMNSENNSIGTIAGSANSTSGFLFNDSIGYTVGSIPGFAAFPGINGITSLNGTTYSMQLGNPIGPGGIAINGPINGGSFAVLLNAGAGAITQVSADPITANMLSMSAGNSNIGTPGAPILVNLGSGGLFGTAYSNLYVNNGTNPLNVYHASSSVGSVHVNSVGPLTIPSCTTDGGDCVTGLSATLTSQGAINIALTPGFNSINTGGGAITLNSGYNYATTSYVAGSATTVTGALVTTGTITLNAGGAITYTGCPSPAVCHAFLYAALVTITDLTVTGESAGNKTYDGTTGATLTGGMLSGVIPGDVVTLVQTGSFASKNVGNGIAVTAADTLTVVTDLSGHTYVLIQPTGLSANITPAMLSVIGQTAANKTYDGNPLASLSGGALSGTVFGGDVVTLTPSTAGAFASKNVGSNVAVTATDSLGGADAGNYTLVQPALTANISAATVTVTGQTALSKTYDGTTAATLIGGTLSGAVPGDVVTLNGSGTFATKNVGTNIAVTVQGGLSGADSGNYVLTPPTGLAANITPLPITVAATGSNKIYNGNTADAVTLAGIGVLVGDNVSFTSTGASFVNANVGSGKTVTVSGIGATGNDAGNYSINNSATTTASIIPATLTVVGEVAQNKVYNGTAAATLIGGSLNGVIPSDAGNVVLNQSGTFASANVGNGIAVNASDSLSGSSAGNYALLQPTGLEANIVGVTTVTDATPIINASNILIIAVNSPTLALLTGTGSGQGNDTFSSGNKGGGGNSGTSGSGTNNQGVTINGNVKKLYCN